jgi:phosphohistidine phosphatase SixA
VKVYLVRHADAGDRETWTGPDEERPLSDRGWRQARGLVDVLADREVGRVLASPYLRCRQTVEPLAEARGLEIEPEVRLAEGFPWREALALVTSIDQPAVMCSQGDIIAALIDDLARQALIAPRDARWQKASTWVLSVKDGAIRKALYIPPPA